MGAKSPTIVLPKNEARRVQLQRKLEEYKKRENPLHAPELQMDTICKVAILERLLRDGRVNTWNLAQELFATYGSGFRLGAFNSGCGVIEDYCKTGGKNVSCGTGLK